MSAMALLPGKHPDHDPRELCAQMLDILKEIVAITDRPAHDAWVRAHAIIHKAEEAIRNAQ